MKMGMQVHPKGSFGRASPPHEKEKPRNGKFRGHTHLGFSNGKKQAFSKKAAGFGFWETYASAFGCGLLGKNGRFSMASTTSFKKAVTSKCCGQARSHCLQPMQSEALPWRRAMLL